MNMKRIVQTLCLLFVANCVMACSNTENRTPLGPIGEAPAEEDPDAEHIYLWAEGNMPTITDYTVNNGNYQDDPDFRPNMIWYPVPDGTAVKGAVMVCPGGAFMFVPAERSCSAVAMKVRPWLNDWRNWAGRVSW